ncbi:MAG: LysR family transcriptional regulator [Deltaproteobacteria bacterium]|nr:LysR family transcriptional regulator [Deltaproteobacteria bacterium]
MDLNAMGIFAEVVDAGSFTAAARRVGLSKSAVSKAVAALEARLGVTLLQRTTRRLRLTEAGEAYYASCALVVAEARRAEEELGSMRDEPRGTLRVNAPIGLGSSFVLPVALEFTARWPDVVVDLTVQDEVVDLLATRTDVAVRVGRLADSSLVARQLSPVRSAVVAAPSYLARRGVPQHPDELAAHEFVRYSLIANPDRLVLLRDTERVSVKMGGAFISNNGEVIRDVLVAGRGLGVMPWFLIADAVREGRLVPVLPDWGAGFMAAFAVYPRGHLLAPKVRLFIDALVERAREVDLFRGEPVAAAAPAIVSQGKR